MISFPPSHDLLNLQVERLTGEKSSSPEEYLRFFSGLETESDANLEATLSSFNTRPPFHTSACRVSQLLAWYLNRAAHVPGTRKLLQRGLRLLLSSCPLEERWIATLLPPKQKQEVTDRLYQNLAQVCEKIHTIWLRLNQIRAYSEDCEDLRPSSRLALAMIIELKVLTGVEQAVFLQGELGLPRTVLYNQENKSIIFFPPAAFSDKGPKEVFQGISLPFATSEPYQFKALLLNNKIHYDKERSIDANLEDYYAEYELQQQLAERVEAIWPIESFFEFSDESDIHHLCAVMQWGSGTLFELISQSKSLPFSEVLSIAKQLAMIIRYLHANKLVHGDLKSTNIYYKEQEGGRLVTLGDYGHAFSLDEIEKAPFTHFGFYGSINCSPFECLGKVDPSKDPFPAEMWAFGYLLYELYFKKSPLWAKYIESCDREKLIDLHSKRLTALRLKIDSTPQKREEELFQLLIVDLLSREAEKRPTACEVLERLEQIEQLM